MVSEKSWARGETEAQSGVAQGCQGRVQKPGTLSMVLTVTPQCSHTTWLSRRKRKALGQASSQEQGHSYPTQLPTGAWAEVQDTLEAWTQESTMSLLFIINP